MKMKLLILLLFIVLFIGITRASSSEEHDISLEEPFFYRLFRRRPEKPTSMEEPPTEEQTTTEKPTTKKPTTTEEPATEEPPTEVPTPAPNCTRSKCCEKPKCIVDHTPNCSGNTVINGGVKDLLGFGSLYADEVNILIRIDSLCPPNPPPIPCEERSESLPHNLDPIDLIKILFGSNP